MIDFLTAITIIIFILGVYVIYRFVKTPTKRKYHTGYALKSFD